MESTPFGMIVTTTNSGDGVMRVIGQQMTAGSNAIGSKNRRAENLSYFGGGTFWNERKM
jgi:hypothetical protein